MKLADWIEQQGITRREAARRLGISNPYMTDLCQGRREPSLDVFRKIVRMTNGAVLADDFEGEAA